MLRQNFVTKSARHTTICWVQYCNRHGFVASIVRGIFFLKSAHRLSGKGGLGRIFTAVGSSSDGTRTMSVSAFKRSQGTISSASAFNLVFKRNGFSNALINGPISTIAVGGDSL